MRRIVLVLVLVVVLAIAGYMLLRPKRSSAQPKSASALTDSTMYGGATGSSAKAGRHASSPAAKAGKVAGTIKASTKAERKAKAQQIRDAERLRKKELARQAREKKRMLSKSARGRIGRTARKGGGLYVLKAIVAVGNENYAMVDARKVQVGDFVMGQKIVQISPDRIEIEAFGKRSTVRVGESLLPSAGR
jgi:hypothetical protein